MKTATAEWPIRENDPQRAAILDAADRLLASTPRHSTGNLSVVQLAIEAGVKYWVVAQKHPDLRDHFQQLVARKRRVEAEYRSNHDALSRLKDEHAELRQHRARLEGRIASYALVINELTLENQALRDQATEAHGTVTPLRRRRRAEE